MLSFRVCAAAARGMRMRAERLVSTRARAGGWISRSVISMLKSTAESARERKFQCGAAARGVC